MPALPLFLCCFSKDASLVVGDKKFLRHTLDSCVTLRPKPLAGEGARRGSPQRPDARADIVSKEPAQEGGLSHPVRARAGRVWLFGRKG